MLLVLMTRKMTKKETFIAVSVPALRLNLYSRTPRLGPSCTLCV